MADNESDRHVRNAADEFIARYGGEAAAQAARRAEELLAAGEQEGYWLWREICETITQLTGQNPDRPKH
ncbi:MAG: hypothetical protein RIB59_03940 [Rhodospirillales bacterium]